MTKISTIDRDACRLIRERLDAALKGALDDLGLSIEVKGASFTSAQVAFKVEVATIGPAGVVMSREATDCKMLAESLGLAADDLGKSFTSRGTVYKIVGCAARSYKAPVLAERVSTGRVFKFPVATVKVCLQAQAQAVK